MSSVRILLRAMVVAVVSAALLGPASSARAEPSVSELTQQINKSSAALEKIVESYNRLKEEIKANQAAAAALQEKIGPLEQETARSRGEVTQIAATAYKTGRLQNASALLSGGSSASLLDRLSALDQLARDRQQRIAGLSDAQRRLLDEKTKLNETLARQNAQAKQLDVGKKKIEADLKRLYELRRQAYGSATTRSSTYRGSVPAVSGSAGVAVRYAYGAVGKPYAWGADGPGSYDCSGLTLAAWRAAGKTLPHNAAMQWDKVTHISRSQLKPGDLVFYSNLGHVGLYVGSGRVIHAPTFGENVKISSVDMMPPYGYGRV